MRRRYASEDDDEPISMWKIGLVIAVILLCFAMLYPTLFRPLFSSFFNPTPPPAQHKPANRPPIHPSMGGARPHPEIHPGQYYIIVYYSKSIIFVPRRLRMHLCHIWKLHAQ